MRDKEKHERWTETQSEAEQQQLSNDVFVSCTALYAHYFLLDPRIKRGTHIHCGVVEADPVDYMIDVCVKAKRALLPAEYALWTRLGTSVETSTLLTAEIKTKLRAAWSNLIPGYYELFKKAQKGWDAQAKRLRKKAQEEAERAALYEAERAAIELLETQEEHTDETKEEHTEA